MVRVLPTTSNLSCKKLGLLTGLNVSGQTRTIAFQLFLQQYGKTSCSFLSPVSLTLKFSLLLCKYKIVVVFVVFYQTLSLRCWKKYGY